MEFSPKYEAYKLKIVEEAIGRLKIGGQDTLPFYLFEGDYPNPPRLALEVQDTASDPTGEAKEREEQGADLIALYLLSTDPTGENRSKDVAAEIAKSVADAVKLPLIVLGSGNAEKDGEVLKEVCAACEGRNIAIGPVTEENYKSLGAAVLAYNHSVIAQTPIDVNLAKQLNILLMNLGLSQDKIIIDPTASALGYGLEYTYSIIERIRLSALTAGDSALAMPIFCNIAKECWKAKEAKESEETGILWEAITGASFLLAGADILVLRHPESFKLLRGFISELSERREPEVVEKPKEEEKVVEIKPKEKIEVVRREDVAYKPEWADELSRKGIEKFLAEKEESVYTKEKSLRERAERDVKTAFVRAEELKPCPFGSAGACCKHCAMGPCRLSFKGEPTIKEQEKGDKVGLCGATIGTIAARNFARMVAAGTAAHSDHAREVAKTFIATAKGEIDGYSIKDEEKLRMLAGVLGIDTENKDIPKIAEEVGEACLAQFGSQEGEIPFIIKRAPAKRRELWRKLNMVPRGIDREVVEMMHRTSIGVDQDIESIIHQASRCALADGWAGSMIATELQDIMFRTPIPLRARVNLGVLSEDKVNIIVHGHEPLLSEMIVAVSRDENLIKKAKEVGAEGINIAGICCTANEILMRHGIPIAGNFLQQELAVATGAVEAMVVDVQCIMQSLVKTAECYHTKVITTQEKARIPGALHIQFDPHNPKDAAEKIVLTAIDNFEKREKDRVDIPKEAMDLVAGFSHETINYMLGGRFRASYRPLNDNIINGRIKGVVGVVGCNNPRTAHDQIHITLIKELIKNNILVVQTGCSAIASAKAGLMTPEAAKFAGSGLAEVCEAVGIPPVLHAGACVDNSRLLVAAAAMCAEGGLGDDPSDLPIAGCAPEWMSEKAIAIGQYFVATGLFVLFGVTFPITGSKALSAYLFEEYEKITGGFWGFEKDPYEMAKLLIAHIEKKREALGIDKPKERILYDMEMRRHLKY